MSLSFIAFLGILSFILGHFLYFFSRRIPEFVCIFLFIVGLYFCGAHNESVSYNFFSKILGERTYNILNFFGGGLIVFASIKSNLIDNFFNKNIFLLLGKLSFSIYLIHIPIMYILGTPIFNIFFNEGFNFLTSALISIFVSLFFTITFSFLYSRYVDDFAIQFSNKLSNLILKKNKNNIFEKTL